MKMPGLNILFRALVQERSASPKGNDISEEHPRAVAALARVIPRVKGNQAVALLTGTADGSLLIDGIVCQVVCHQAVTGEVSTQLKGDTRRPVASRGKAAAEASTGLDVNDHHPNV